MVAAIEKGAEAELDAHNGGESTALNVSSVSASRQGNPPCISAHERPHRERGRLAEDARWGDRLEDTLPQLR